MIKSKISRARTCLATEGKVDCSGQASICLSLRPAQAFTKEVSNDQRAAARRVDAYGRALEAMEETDAPARHRMRVACSFE